LPKANQIEARTEVKRQRILQSFEITGILTCKDNVRTIALIRTVVFVSGGIGA
jgi:hypothetical protein